MKPIAQKQREALERVENDIKNYQNKIDNFPTPKNDTDKERFETLKNKLNKANINAENLKKKLN